MLLGCPKLLIISSNNPTSVCQCGLVPAVYATRGTRSFIVNEELLPVLRFKFTASPRAGVSDPHHNGPGNETVYAMRVSLDARLRFRSSRGIRRREQSLTELTVGRTTTFRVHSGTTTIDPRSPYETALTINMNSREGRVLTRVSRSFCRLQRNDLGRETPHTQTHGTYRTWTRTTTDGHGQQPAATKTRLRTRRPFIYVSSVPVRWHDIY